MIKRLLCVLMMLMLLTVSTFSLAEETNGHDDASNDSSTTVEEHAISEDTDDSAKETSPVLLATINGYELYDNDIKYNQYINENLYTLAMYGLDEEAEDYHYYLDYFKDYALSIATAHAFYIENAKKLDIKIDSIDRESYESNVRDYWNSLVESYIDDIGLSETATEEDKNTARDEALAFFLDQYGYTEESFVLEKMQEYDYYMIEELTENELTKDITVDEAEIKELFDEKVNDQKAIYDKNPSQYNSDKRNGQSVYYIPYGYRGVTHILLKVDEELLNTWLDLQARFEEQISNADLESIDPDKTAEQSNPADNPESIEKDTSSQIPVTQEMVDSAKKDIFESVQPIIDEIMVKFNKGTPFSELITEYGTDPGMTNDEYKNDGYMICDGISGMDQTFVNAGMALQKVGDVSEPVLSQFGVHLVYFLKEIESGAVEYTDEIREILKTELLDNKKNDMLSNMYHDWISSVDIQYTEEGKRITEAGPVAIEYLMSQMAESESTPSEQTEVLDSSTSTETAEGTEEAEAPEAETPEAEAANP